MVTVREHLAREEAITEALSVAGKIIGDQPATQQALQIIAAIKRLRDGQLANVAALAPVDYLSQVQEAARANWQKAHGPYKAIGPERNAVAGIETPQGRLKMVTWRTTWRNGARVAWAGEYYLNEQPITVAEIKAAGLAQRPTMRNRKAKA